MVSREQRADPAHIPVLVFPGWLLPARRPSLHVQERFLQSAAGRSPRPGSGSHLNARTRSHLGAAHHLVLASYQEWLGRQDQALGTRPLIIDASPISSGVNVCS